MGPFPPNFMLYTSQAGDLYLGSLDENRDHGNPSDSLPPPTQATYAPLISW